ncbi:hypothetical protein F5050DRAFT_1560088 [Lentinula boryana]|uniref:S-adenosyl-L-methionine-dependent methyltransferase n=1 Tax=Lentinula boryana TaxID=40481 RepID=A0ABQ8QSQ3_9AGAR|nr:hypothetical protein F5050DRAFT_1560088 [Lentinula boryana]
MPDLSSPAIDPPTSYLPSIRSLSSFKENHRLHDCIEYLRQIYVPNVRGSRRRKPKQQDPSNILFSTPHSPITTIRKDPFERAYALRWLSALTRLEPPTDLPELDDIQNAAAALLAICAGTASAGTVQRRFEFAGGRIQIVLNDVPLSTDASSNGDYFGSVGAQTWGGAFVLAEEIAESDSITFFPNTTQEPFRVLELGAGTGLVSLVAGKVAMLTNCPKGRQVDIIATDYYPSVLDNLKANIEANFPSSISPLNITSRFLDWSSFSSFDITPDADADASLPSNNNIGTFDLILGADIIYEPLHASWIRRVVENTLRKSSLSTEKKNCPDRNNGGQGLFHLVIPLRPSFVAESSTIEQEFRFEDELVILSREIIICDADEDDDDDNEEADIDIDLDGRNSVSDDTRSQVGEGNIVRYVYYIIGWEG